MSKTISKIWVLLFMIGVFLTFGFNGCSKAGTESNAGPSVAVAGTPAPPAAPVAANLIDFRHIIAEVAQKNIPAVAHIEVTQQQEVNTPFLPFQNDPFFHFFFNMPRNMPHKFKRELKGLGSGMIMDAQGNILTNNHVVAGATEIQVLLADGSQYKAKLVGTDPKTDLAVIKIKADKPLPHVIFGDSDRLNVGDWVVAIGHPRGLDQTVTQGIISAKHRRGILDPNTYQDYLQTDAAINPGNSGGPLINLSGEVIGVNAAIESESGGFEGIGFAIPSNMAVHIARQLMAHGKVERGWLGVSIKDMTPALAKSMKLDVTKGALVAEVVKGSPADTAGLKKDDVITGYQGHAIEDASGLQNRVADTAIGETASMTVVRDGRTVDLTVRIGDLKDAVKALAASAEARLGATVRPITAKEAEKYGIQEDAGVAIDHLNPNGPLAQAGFEENDVITAINNIPVNGVQGFADIVKALPAKQNVVLTAVDHRTGQTGYVQLVTQ